MMMTQTPMVLQVINIAKNYHVTAGKPVASGDINVILLGKLQELCRLYCTYTTSTSYMYIGLLVCRSHFCSPTIVPALAYLFAMVFV